MRNWLCAILFLTIAGCAVGPDYHRPPVQAPPVFRGGALATNSLGDLAWWQVFSDPTLQNLIRTALTNNHDARIAAARVEQARAIWGENRSLFFPQVNYLGGIGVGKNVQNNVPASTGGKSGMGILADANVSWEIDLFGRIRRLNESARAQFFASEEGRRNILSLLVADVAQAYFQLLALDQEFRIACDSTNSFGQSLKIFSERYRGGVASKLEVASAEALMASAATSALEIQRQTIAQENLICMLLGVNPRAVARGRGLLAEELSPDVPPGLPSALLERRPDIRQAEDNLRSANALIGVAKADFFPRLTLTGLLGQTSSELSTFTAGANNAWTVAAGLAGPIFEGGLLKSQYHAARAVWDETRLEYESTILTAFREVADALAGRDIFAAERIEQTRAVAAYEEAVKLANERFTQGRASYYEVLQEQQLLFPAENTLTQIQLDQLLSVIQLYRALGGGWERPAAK
ncbi:MAG TPA: efflux transporter outer membrane subunit [Verrucomicrobiae bacterium]|jgi:multidrug efflux system outer membrane protein|nr:efflux transporter outer membrane subunit [Verrucomicrobiae bacterium]